MSKIKIKKHISLEFLGEEYQGAELVFQSIPLSDYDKLMDELPKPNAELTDLAEKQKSGEITEEETARLQELMNESGLESKNSLNMITKYLKKYFISGKFPDDDGSLQDVGAEDLDGLDQETAMICFEGLTGNLDPKAKTQ